MSKISQIAVIDLIPLLLLVNIVIVLHKRFDTFDHSCQGSTFHETIESRFCIMDIFQIPCGDWDILDETVVLISFVK